MISRIASLHAAVLLIFLPLFSGCGINSIPAYDEAVTAAWSQVVNQYQRRADLIPNLVATVKGFAAQEREVLTAVTAARAKVAQMKISKDILTDRQAFEAFQQHQATLDSALSRLLVTVERYPELRSNQNFLTLQSQLEGTENRVAVARRDFIQAVQRYNTELRTYPGRIWATLLYPDAESRENFSVSAEDQQRIEQPPTVSFE